jgi:hypothetical protein
MVKLTAKMLNERRVQIVKHYIEETVEGALSRENELGYRTVYLRDIPDNVDRGILENALWGAGYEVDTTDAVGLAISW